MDAPPPLLSDQPAAPERGFFRRFALPLKLGGIAFLILFLKFPLLMIDGLLQERLQRRDSAVAEITSTWGHAQRIIGPILVVPYQVSYAAEKTVLVNGKPVHTTEEKLRDAYAFFLPDRLNIEGQLEPAKRKRGIYEAVVYGSQLKISGSFAAPDLAALQISPERMQWHRAWLAFALSDLRGTREALSVNWQGSDLPLSPGTNIEGLGTGLHVELPPLGDPTTPHSFSLELSLNGSDSIAFTPLGRQTDVVLRSTWSDPGFTGAFLPVQRDVTPNGFTAHWQVSYYGRDFAQQWLDRDETPSIDPQPLNASTFGANLVTLVDGYRGVERATKYGALFMVLIFTAFFLFEVLAALKLHALHYLLVGAALCLFYLALLSLSEFVAFEVAYLAAAIASTLLICLYCRSILKSGTRSLVIAGALGGIYGFLFFVLQMQDYALLAGTGGLFAVLAVVMFTTRRINWSSNPQPA